MLTLQAGLSEKAIDLEKQLESVLAKTKESAGSHFTSLVATPAQMQALDVSAIARPVSPLNVSLNISRVTNVSMLL
jgi:hypothetical protein